MVWFLKWNTDELKDQNKIIVKFENKATFTFLNLEGNC